MSKSEDKRKEILAASELLFSKKGYEETTVQDILDATEMSKGGFYYYFPSKESILNMICLTHAEYSSIGCGERLIPVSDPLTRLNMVLSSMIPLRLDEAPFFRIIFPLMTKPEGRAMRSAFEDMLSDAFKPVLRRELSLACDDQVIFPRMDDPETVLLPVINSCWREAAEMMRYRQEIGKPLDGGEMMRLIEKYRRSVEVLLDAPYGSIVLIGLEEMLKTAKQLTE